MPFFRAEKKKTESKFFFARTHTRLKNSKFLTHKYTQIEDTGVLFCSSHKYVYFIHFRDGFIGKSLSRLLSRARFPGLGFFFFFSRDFLSPCCIKEEGE